MLYAVLRSVFHALPMNTDSAVTVRAANALARGDNCLAHRDVLPSPLCLIPSHKLPALLAMRH
jgi:hypothetical protein